MHQSTRFAVLFTSLLFALGFITPVLAQAVAIPTASGFMGTIGVNTHLHQYTGVYTTAAATQALSYLGIAQIRDDIVEWQQMLPIYQSMLAAGARFDMVIPGTEVNANGYTGLLNMFRSIAASGPANITAVEGPNEVNIWPVNWNGCTTLACQGIFQKQFYSDVKADPVLKNYPVFNLTLAFENQSDYTAVGNLSAAADYANIHPYVYPYAPGASIAADKYSHMVVTESQWDAPGLPIAVTETGYYTLPNGSNGVDETTQAKYTLDTIFDSARTGAKYTYFYELLDEDTSNTTNPEMHYGLFHSDGTPKPAATAVRNLAAILGDASAATGLQYTVANPSLTGHSYLFQKSNGAYDIAVWNEEPAWDPSKHVAITEPVQAAVVTLPQAYANVSVFDPMVGTAPISTYTNVSQVQAPLTDHPMVIEVGAQVTALVDTTAPSTPANLAATAISTSRINLAWIASTDNVGVVGYNVYRNGAKIGPAISTSYSDTNLSASTQYSYTVSAYDAAGNTSAQSGSASATTQALLTASQNGTTIPSATQIIDSAGGIWTVSSGIVYLNGAAAGYSNQVILLLYYNGVIYQENSAGGWWSWTNSTWLAVSGDPRPAQADTTPPSTPTGLTATAASTTIVNLSWSASTDNVAVTGYKVYRNGAQVGTSAGTSYVDANLIAGTTYSYTVSAYDAAGNTSAQSSSASVTTLKVPTPTPTGFSIGARIKTTANLNVRSSPSTNRQSKVLCTQRRGSLGTIVGGPTVASGYTWYNINFDTRCDGWSIQNYLVPLTLAEETSALTQVAAAGQTQGTLKQLEQQLTDLLMQLQTMVAR